MSSHRRRRRICRLFKTNRCLSEHEIFIVGKQCKFGARISCETHSRRLHLRPGRAVRVRGWLYAGAEGIRGRFSNGLSLLGVCSEIRYGGGGDGGGSGFRDNKLDVTRTHLHKGCMCVAFSFTFLFFFFFFFCLCSVTALVIYRSTPQHIILHINITLVCAEQQFPFYGFQPRNVLCQMLYQIQMGNVIGFDQYHFYHTSSPIR